MNKTNFLLQELGLLGASKVSKRPRASRSFSTENQTKYPVLFAVHGTISDSNTWSRSHGTLVELVKFYGFNENNATIDKEFNWNQSSLKSDENLNCLTNSPEEREAAAKYLFDYVSVRYQMYFPEFSDMYERGNQEELASFYESHPIILVAHSHGGNVCIQSLNLFKEYGVKIYLATIATPSTRDHRENVAQFKGTLVAHSHWWTSSDPIVNHIRSMLHRTVFRTFSNGLTYNYWVPTQKGHSFHSESPSLFSDCIAHYKIYKERTYPTAKFHDELKSKYGTNVIFVNPDYSRSSGGKQRMMDQYHIPEYNGYPKG